MLYQFLLNFVDTFGFLNVFKYITFRTGLSLFTSLAIVLIISGPFIKYFSSQKILNPIRDDGPEEHIVKKIGTPTMGGVIILIGLLVSVLCWGDLTNINILFCIYIAISFGVLGAFDDYKKIKHSNSSGVSSKFKIISQIILAIIGVCFFVYYVVVMLDTPQKAKDYYYKYRHRKGGWKGTLYNTAGWTSVEVAGKIIDKVGPILATKYIEIK